MNTRRIAAHYIYTPRGFLKNGLLSINPEGVITAISEHHHVDSIHGVEFYPGILIPGMVNAHTHLELSHLKGSVVPGCGFAGFAAGLREVRGRFSVKEMQDSAEYNDAKMWSEGVQAVGDISNSALTSEQKKRSHITYHTFAEVYGLQTDSIRNVCEVADAFRNNGLMVSVTPHSTYSLNEEVFKQAINSGKTERFPLSVHFMESEGEQDLYRGRGNLYDWYVRSGFETDFTDSYDSPAERIIRCVPSHRPIMLVHNTFVGAGDVKMLNDHFGENITWVLCPRSNRYISGEVPPVSLLRESGARIAVGTDSLASNYDLSMIEELKAFDNVGLEELLSWATVNGATALGLDAEIGSLEVGRSPGIVLLEGANMDTFCLTPQIRAKRLI